MPWKQKVVQAFKGFCIGLKSGHASWEDQVCKINADLTQKMAWKLPMAGRPDRTTYKNYKTPFERKGLCILRKILIRLHVNSKTFLDKIYHSY